MNPKKMLPIFYKIRVGVNHDSSFKYSSEGISNRKRQPFGTSKIHTSSMISL